LALIIYQGIGASKFDEIFKNHQKHKCRRICIRTSFGWCFSL